MEIKKVFTDSTMAKHYRELKAAPRETIANRWLILTSMLYATAAMPLSESRLLFPSSSPRTLLTVWLQHGIKRRRQWRHLFQDFNSTLAWEREAAHSTSGISCRSSIWVPAWELVWHFLSMTELVACGPSVYTQSFGPSASSLPCQLRTWRHCTRHV